jgi:hypothetical protein
MPGVGVGFLLPPEEAAGPPPEPGPLPGEPGPIPGAGVCAALIPTNRQATRVYFTVSMRDSPFLGRV